MIGGIAGGALLVIIAVIVAILLLRRRRRNVVDSEVPLQERKAVEAKITTITDVRVGTRLGGGHFSDVYSGEWQVKLYHFERILMSGIDYCGLEKTQVRVPNG
jgi:hypothetical protein